MMTAAKSEASGHAESPTRRLGGLLVRRQAWKLSWRGWLVLIAVAAGAIVFLQRTLYSFLAVTDPVPPSECLIVEGWLKVDQLRLAYDEFKKGGYRYIVTEGSRAEDQWDPKLVVTYADWAAGKLKRIGVPPDCIRVVRNYTQKRDRTYTSAVAVREWMKTNNIHLTEFNLMSAGAHARRSRLLFEKAFGPDVKIGIIAIEDEQFDSAHWWRTSEGVRDVLGETIAYVYARFFFSPATQGPPAS